ncbi:IPT/TIG domain-containing protein [Algoriphagus boseongensis]|uniref:IPT/TIG domain-containing protein n=1 Tax=Algoriphagus boseongensis TaxID=1442587 RepID=A0A4R6T5W8_9BACT|nr:IPT/TIG domain-containing protein [Algoriphagus boseongensis]TDQ17404.1 IPT/TIG domain-containing protein [Algoriphagus boseongensis]
MQKLLFLSILCLLLVGWACTEDTETPIIVATEEAIFVGGDRIRISGRLITNQEVSASDHGFQISETEAFSSPVTISLGAKEGPGRFIGEATGLKITQNYWVKAFSVIGGEEISGEAVQIQTLEPQLESFSPRFSTVGKDLVINGRNFPEGTKVFFGDKEAQIVQNLFESRITVKIPAPGTSAFVPIRVVVQNKTLEFSEKFEYQSGKYTKVTDFPDPRIYNSVSFTNELGFHVGLGEVRLTGPYRKFQRYNLATGTWTEVSFPGNPRSFAFATPNFLGGGALEIDRDVFQYDQSFYKINGSTFERLADLPFRSQDQLAIEVGGDLYLFGGRVVNSQAVRKYSNTSKTWSNLANAPFALTSENPFFVYQGQIFIFNSAGELYQFNPSNSSWTLRTKYPGSLGQSYGVAVVQGAKAYVGLYRRTQEMYELDLSSFTWKIKNPIPGLPQSITVGQFEYNGAIYIMRVPEVSVNGVFPMELYKFETNAL